MKTGRNDPCPCGSGKKYKRCCLELDEAMPPPARREPGGRLLARPFMHAELHGKRFVAVGDGVLVQSAAETEHQFWLRVLRMTLGERRHDGQMALPESKRHVVLRWLDHWDALRRGEVAGIEPEQISETRFSAQATGDLLALFSLAYDVYTLRHALALPDVLIERIRLPDQFQGARYELAIAAVFSRAGYELEWLTARDRKLPEFIATHQTAKTEIAVEAKSRHRPGVLGRAGTQPELDVLKADVVGLLRKATQKETDGRPFVICIDLNLPHARAKSAEEWVAELHENVLSQFGPAVTGQPDAFSALSSRTTPGTGTVSDRRAFRPTSSLCPTKPECRCRRVSSSSLTRRSHSGSSPGPPSQKRPSQSGC